MIDKLIEILKQFGVSEKLLLALAILAFVITIVSAIVKVFQWAILKNHQWLLNENLRPYFSIEDVDRATRYYVPTKFQNISPTVDDEPGKSHLGSAKQLLMPMFLDKAFKDTRDSTKYYLILADAGMGKTTFLINLFLNYTSRPLKNLLGINSNQGIRLLPLGSPDIWKDIEKIENKRDTILLLDAFDEDIKAVDDYDARMKEILAIAKEFKQIVVTCRTQFFPSDKEIPDDTGDVTFGGEQNRYKFQRAYLSVFDESDINKYLKKRFSVFQQSKRKRAFEIVKKSPNLVMRPMLLSYINDFVEADKTFNHSYEIYEVLIEKWIERESKKHGIRQKYGSEEKYRELLLDFSQALAKNIYEKRKERGGLFITKKDFIKDTPEFQITDLDIYGMTETEVRSKSLLNRNAEGQYKFSHKSILEYFLGKELFQTTDFLSIFDFDGMSATEMFLDEMVSPFRKLNCSYGASLNPNSLIPINLLSIKEWTEIETLKIHDLRKFDLLQISLIPNLKHLIIDGCPAFTYNYYYLLHRLKYPEVSISSEKEYAYLKCAKLSERLELLNIHNVSESAKFLEIRFFQGYYMINLISEGFFGGSDHHLIESFPPVIEFLRKVRLIQDKIPDCRFTFNSEIPPAPYFI